MNLPRCESMLRVNIMSIDSRPGITAEIGVTRLSNPLTELLAKWKLVEYTLGLRKRKIKDKVSLRSMSSNSSPTDVSS